MKILINLACPDFAVSVALHEDGQTVSVGLVGKPVLVSFPTVGERTIKAGYWEVTGKPADYIAHAANRAERDPSQRNISDFLKVLGYYLPVKEESVPLSKVEEVSVNVGVKMGQEMTRVCCEWFEEVLHKIGAHCGAYYMSDVPRLVLETVKEAQEEIERRKEVLSPNPPIKPIPIEESYDFDESDLLPACPVCDHGMARRIVVMGPLTCLGCGYVGEAKPTPAAPKVPHPRSMEFVRR